MATYQVLILHDSGTTGAGDVIAAGYTDLTADGKYDASTMTVRTDGPNPASVYSDPEKTQYHRWDGVSAYVLSNKDYDVSAQKPRWDDGSSTYKIDNIVAALGGDTREFIVTNIPTNGIVRLIGDFRNIASNQTANFTTTRSIQNKRLRIIVNTITTGGDIVITGTSIDNTTGIKTTSDTETITVDTTADQSYSSDKSWVETTLIDVSGTTTIDYDFGVDGGDTFFGSKFKITGYDMDALSNGTNSDFRLRIRKYSVTTGKKIEFVEIEDRGIDSSAGNGNEIDGLRTAGDDRAYTYSAIAFPDDSQIGFTMNDFDTFFTSGENIIDGSNGESLFVQVRGQGQAAMTNIENFRFVLKYQTIA